MAFTHFKNFYCWEKEFGSSGDKQPFFCAERGILLGHELQSSGRRANFCPTTFRLAIYTEATIYYIQRFDTDMCGYCAMRMLDSLCSSQIMQSALELTAKYTSLPFCLSTKANNKNESKKLTLSRHMISFKNDIGSLEIYQALLW